MLRTMSNVCPVAWAAGVMATAAVAGVLWSGPARAATIPLDWLVVSEVMANPAAVSDTAGEWFELTNLGHLPVDLHGLVLADDGASRHTIRSPREQLMIDPGEFFVFGRLGDATRNGGYEPDYVYSGFGLSNGADQVRILEGEDEVARLDFGAGFAVAGASRELGTLPMLGDNYLLAVEAYGLGDLGTPGLAGQFNSVPAVVPLPASIWMLLGAGAVLLRWRRAPVSPSRRPGRAPAQ